LFLDRYQCLQTNLTSKLQNIQKTKQIKSPRNTQQITYKLPQTKLKHNIKTTTKQKTNTSTTQKPRKNFTTILTPKTFHSFFHRNQKQLKTIKSHQFCNQILYNKLNLQPYISHNLRKHTSASKTTQWPAHKEKHSRSWKDNSYFPWVHPFYPREKTEKIAEQILQLCLQRI